MRITVVHTLDGLEDDLRAMPRKEAREMTAVVRDGARIGNQLAREHARRTARKHGKHYPNAMTPETKKPFVGFGAAVYSAEYGPVVGRPQGEMSFEFGSRNQPPHFDLATSADMVGPALVPEVRDALDRMFW